MFRAWRAGIISAVAPASSILTATLLWYWRTYAVYFTVFAIVIIVALIIGEYYRQIAPLCPIATDLKLNIFPGNASGEEDWLLRTTDDAISDWKDDVIGRASVVEVLASRVLTMRTPTIALVASFGDGKSSVLNLFRRAVGNQAIVVSFNAWLPGSEATFATDLFRDIVAECRKVVYVPQLRKLAVGYARSITGSISYLTGLRDLFPNLSQREEINELLKAFHHVPRPVVVLLDDIDRMQREELLVLLKILRGATSIPNVSFICAFSNDEIRRKLAVGDEVANDYLEKFFPITINLSAPDPDMLGRLFNRKLMSILEERQWFSETAMGDAFMDLLDKIWEDALSQLVTNLRKAALLLNDIHVATQPIVGDVDPFDLIVIEAIRRFCPDGYNLVRKNATFLTLGSDLDLGRYGNRGEDREAKTFFEKLRAVVVTSGDSSEIESMLGWLFPAYDRFRAPGVTVPRLARPTNREIATVEKRICDPDHFPIYFRASIPAEMFSDAELRRVIQDLSSAYSEDGVRAVYLNTLRKIAPGHAKRWDFLWKLGRKIAKFDYKTAEYLAYAASSCAADYSYDEFNIGEAGAALNIVFNTAERLSNPPTEHLVEQLLLGSMARATDDTFAVRLLRYTTSEKHLNRIFTSVADVNELEISRAFVERMRTKYHDASLQDVNIDQSDWAAFRDWVDNSDDDKQMEQEFWREFIDKSYKRLAQAINFIYPGGNFVWSDNPAPIIDKLFPLAEVSRLLRDLPSEPLDDVETEGIERFRRLLNGDYRKPGQW